jgi:hypothetical protein
MIKPLIIILSPSYSYGALPSQTRDCDDYSPATAVFGGLGPLPPFLTAKPASEGIDTLATVLSRLKNQY